MGKNILWCKDSLPSDTVPDRKVRVFGLPVLFFSYDTGWGFGGGGIVSFKGQPLRSSVLFSVAYTQRKQWLLYFPYQWYGGKWRVNGEVGWYRYLYQFFGIGNRYSNDFIEYFTAQYPRLRLNVARSINARSLVGLRYSMDYFNMLEREPNGLLVNYPIPGANGGFSSGLGAVWIYDTRDNPFYAKKGFYAETFILSENKLTGSPFQYVRCSNETAWYQSLGRSKKVVWANQFSLQLTYGAAPFFSLPQLGGPKRLRGYFAGKYRDQHAVSLQSELRVPLFWRLKGVGFASLGSVMGSPSENPQLRYDAGAGLRFEFDKKQHIHLRLDYARGGLGNSALYVTIGEAF